MSKGSKIVFFLILLTLTTTSAVVSVKLAKAENGRTLIVPQDFPSINAAIGGASQGDTILVKEGVYRENLLLDKTLSLKGENKATTIIDGNGKGAVVWINANGVALSGFTLQNSGSNFTDSGIYLNNSLGSNLSDNLVSGNNIGIYIYESGESNLRGNIIRDNEFNFGVYSSNLEGYIQDIDASNTVNGKPIFYLVNQAGKQSPQDAGYIAIVNCTEITVNGAFLERNWQNLLLAYTKNSTITETTSTLGMDSIWLIESSNCSLIGNNITGNIWGGVAFVNSFNCTFHRNMLKSNGGYGIFLSDSSNNLFYHNNFIANSRQVWLFRDNYNSWDNGYQSGGNYWDNYTGVDVKTGVNQTESGSDGIVDTPVVLDQNNIDNYPLMRAWSQHTIEEFQPRPEFSVMASIAVASILVIFVVYFVKARINGKQQSKER